MLNLSALSVEHRLKKLDLSVEPGQLIGLIGANGAGKSTLLKALAKLTPATSGIASWQQLNMLTWSPQQQRQHLAYMGQTSQFLEPVLVSNLLEFSQINLRENPSKLAHWREESINNFELHELLMRPVTELSGGEQRRVAIACMAALGRPLLLLDEPVAGLDLYYQLLTMDWLRNMAQQQALVFVAMHDLSLAAQYCDKILLLDHGEKLAFGPPNEVLSDTNLAHAYRVGVDWICNSKGVAMLAHRLSS